MKVSGRVNYFLVGGVGIALLVLVFAFRSFSAHRKSADVVRRVEKSTQRRGKGITLAAARKQVAKKAAAELPAGYRLGKVLGWHVDKNGRGTAWEFVYIYSKPGDDKHIYKKAFRWSKGQIQVGGEERIFKPGLNTANYDYLFKELGSDLVDPGKIVRQAIKIEGREDKTTGYGINLYWQTDILKDAPIYVVDPYFFREKKLYFNAKTGERVAR